MTESTRPSENPYDVGEGVALNEEDRVFLESIGSTTKTAVVESLDEPATVDALYLYLCQEEKLGSESVFTMVTEEGYWLQLYQKSKWATLAMMENTRIEVMEKLWMDLINAERTYSNRVKIEKLQQLIHDITN